MFYGSVCSGIEAATVAWKPLGWKAAWLSEIEPFPCAVLAHHYPDVPNHGDMTKLKEKNLAAVDLIVGGTPCQSFSVAGLRKGLDDPRGNLSLEYLALVDRVRPRWFLWENVPGILSSNGGRDFGSFLGAVAELGYGFAYRVLDAQFVRVDGLRRAVPQRRRRVFVVGYLGDWRYPAAVLFERHCLSWHSPPSRKAGERVTQSLTQSLGSGGADDNKAQGGMIVPFGGNNTSGPVDVSTACNGKGGSGRMDFETETLIAHTLTKRYDSSEDGCGRGVPIVAGAHAPVAAFMAGQGSKAGSIAYQDEVSPTLKGVNSGLNQAPSIHRSMSVRRLMPIECERLMGFPDNYTLIPYCGKPAADGPRYKAIGNSMAVNVMRWIGRRIEMVEDAG